MTYSLRVPVRRPGHRQASKIKNPSAKALGFFYIRGLAMTYCYVLCAHVTKSSGTIFTHPVHGVQPRLASQWQTAPAFLGEGRGEVLRRRTRRISVGHGDSHHQL